MADLSAVPIADLELASSSFEDRLSRFFTLRELIRSDVAARNAIDNRFQEVAHLRAAAQLARNVLDFVRSEHGPFAPNSVYRSQAVERVLKKKPHNWKSDSQHTLGEACDIEIAGLPTLELAKWAAEKLPAFDQLICECFDPREGPNSGWVHISLRSPGATPNRRQLLSYVKHPATGKYVYVEGLRASA
jgi:hypothetical protein